MKHFQVLFKKFRIKNLLKPLSFKRKITLFSILISIVPLLLLGLFSTNTAVNSIQAEVGKSHQAFLKQIDFQLGTFLNSLDELTYQLASDNTVSNSVNSGLTNQSSSEALEVVRTVHQYKTYSDININVSIIYDKFNRVYSTQYGYINKSEFDYRGINEIIASEFNGSTVISPFTYPSQDELLFVRPISDIGEREGWVIIHANTDRLVGLLSQIVEDYSGKLLIVDENEQVVLGSHEEDIGSRINSSTQLYQLLSNPGSFEGIISSGGTDYTPALLESSFNDWNLLAMTPVTALSGVADKIRYLTWGMTALISVVWIIVIIMFSNRLYFPLKKLMTNFPSLSKEPSERTDEFTSLEQFLNNSMETNEQLKNELAEQSSFIKENVERQMLLEGMKIEELNEKTEYLSLQGPWFYVCIVEIDKFSNFRKLYNEKDQSIMMYALSKMVDEISEPTFSNLTVRTKPGHVALVIGVKEADTYTNDVVEEISSIIREKVMEYLGFSVSIAVSSAREGYNSIKECYQHALTLLNYRFTMGNDVTISDKNTDSSGEIDVDVIKLKKSVISSIAHGNFDRAEKSLVELIDLISRKVENYESILGFFAYLIGEVHLFIDEMGYDKNEFFEDDLYQQLNAKNNIEEVKHWLIEDVFHSIAEKKDALLHLKQEQTIKNVIGYIHENIGTDLSLQLVADEFNMSISELSKAFKAQTDTNFSNYVIDLRIERAKGWLIHSNKPIKEISQELCYSNVHNFTRVFKNIEGLPPGQFRKKYRDGA
ncbi:AraC family transcriptional regulator [Lentibacillus sediminis]|uniref:AraC family transcriptional regulator n=1 Tax=Lentibacillus sediminis TaxID=1940529 RepID=UPI000C1C7989|nr:AraC family transcriptional regulator [Lentibacillus sediminis]